MAEPIDVNNLLEIFLIGNLSNITNERLSLNFPIGFQSLINTEVINNVPDVRFPADLRELLVDYVLTRERGDFRSLRRLRAFRRIGNIGIKKQQREFFR